MSDIAFLPGPAHLPGANIKVVGVGGAGCNALNRMIESGVSGIQFIAMNTDQQSLAQCRAETRISLGPSTMRGLGAGGDPERGQCAAEESHDEILSGLNGADMVFITAGMGGGTGTGASPVIANCASQAGALAVAVVITPFHWEGRGKLQRAARGLDRLRDVADSVIVVSNERLKGFCDRSVNTLDAYGAADSVLIQGVRGISDLILRPGIINGDFADVKAVLCNSREALIGTGMGRGDDAVRDGVRRALECPLLERDRQGSATRVIVSVMADWRQIPLSAIEEAMNFLMDHYSGQPDIKLCQAEVPDLDDRVLVTLLASGFDDSAGPAGAQAEARPEPPAPAPGTVRIYGGEAASGAEPGKATRLLPPTPSGELGGPLEDINEPSINRLRFPNILCQPQGRLPLE